VERFEILNEKQSEKYRLEITDLTGEETGNQVEIYIPEELNIRLLHKRLARKV